MSSFITLAVWCATIDQRYDNRGSVRLDIAMESESKGSSYSYSYSHRIEEYEIQDKNVSLQC